ncbi:MAG: SURF1 family protein [Ilumatobacteraceae bacterium]|nr:SURF1 family protein [Ilumatobacteraceae bacterium]
MTVEQPRISYRFLLQARWIAFHLVVVLGIVLMINLGFWQLDRLDQRQSFNASVEARSDEPVVPLADLLGAPDFDPNTAQWRIVTATGTWIEDQVVVFNRTQGGRAGDNVVTALATDDGEVVLVNRGFIPLTADVPAPPDGTVTVTGRVRPTQERQTGQLTDTADGPLTEIRRIEIARLAPQFGGSLAPVYLDLVESSPAVTDTDPTPVPPPELDDGPHLSYAMQWFIFAVCVLIGWVLAVRRSIKTRRAALRPPATTRPMPAAAAPDSAPQAADAATRARSETDPASPR